VEASEEAEAPRAAGRGQSPGQRAGRERAEADGEDGATGASGRSDGNKGSREGRKPKEEVSL
jgi:hypothetical protein